MRPMIRMFVLAALSASATVAFALDRVMVNVPFNFESDGKTFRQALIRWNLPRTTTLSRFPENPTGRCPSRGSLPRQNLALMDQRSRLNSTSEPMALMRCVVFGLGR